MASTPISPQSLSSPDDQSVTFGELFAITVLVVAIMQAHRRDILTGAARTA